ncbi:MAG: RnfH family protein [Burkholderiaceae bacterium]
MGNERRNAVKVEVLYAQPDIIWRRNIEVPEGATVAQAIDISGLLQSFPEFGHQFPPVGIFGRACAPQQVLVDGDRLEIYRPLVFEPMESRRRRIRHRARRGGKPA